MDILENLFYGGMFIGFIIGMALMTVIFLVGLTLSDRKEEKMDLDEEELKATRKMNGADEKKTKENKEEK